MQHHHHVCQNVAAHAAQEELVVVGLAHAALARLRVLPPAQVVVVGVLVGQPVDETLHFIVHVTQSVVCVCYFLLFLGQVEQIPQKLLLFIVPFGHIVDRVVDFAVSEPLDLLVGQL
eukprot:2201510-Rhodomonas_salina.1